MGLDYMEKELLSLYTECEPCYDKFLEDVQKAVCSIEYGCGGELFHRGYYFPSPFFDLVVGNANRGRLVKRPRKDAVYDYIYYKDQAGNLIMVDKYSGNTDVDKELYYREFIIKSGSREIAPCFEFCKFLGQINIVSLSLCEYSDGKIILYRNMLRHSTKKEDGTVSYIPPSIHAEDYKYHSSGLIEQAVYGEKLDKLFREISYKFFHYESGILYEYEVVDHYGVSTEPRIYQVQKSKLRVV